ncbi:sporulation protein YjcZ [Aneurinibacillus terranovensis]|nr:sporulation protein YjcZ [Aneurinibacillus terranovensis]
MAFSSFFGPGNEIGVILVLFILLVIIACSCQSVIPTSPC